MRILLVEDSERLAHSIQSGLRRLGHGVDVVHDGDRGLSYARNNPYDLVLLDVMLPGRDGFSVLRALRDDGVDVHVLMLTARDAVEDRVHGLQAGADDYLVKPFAFDELAARVDALGRRVRGPALPVVTIGDLKIDTSARSVTRGERVLDLSRREYALITYLASRRGETASRIEIEDQLYDEDSLPMSNVVASTVCSLREKLESGGAPRLIHTRRGLGYMLADSPP
ncbi:MAG: response regulator transcription factor [Planctomycetes bacterium]|nr:response regulator transcription factor [Planctomycetota bacterium]